MRDPTIQVVCGAYNEALASDFSLSARRIAEQEESGVTLSKDRNQVINWQTDAGGGFRAIGVGTGITGRGANLIIIDDPVKSREEAESPVYRNRVYNWYRDDIYTRREPGCAIIIIMTRWHDDDLAGRLLKDAEAKGETWTIINLPALAEDDDPLGRFPGQALCPDRFDEAELESIRGVMGERSFVSLYQQKPRPDEGALFKRQWFKITDVLPGDLRFVRFWDLAVSVKESADFTVGAKVGLDRDGNIYIADIQRGRWEWPESRRNIISAAQQDGHMTRVGVEQVAFQLAAIQDLRRDPQFLRTPLKGVAPGKGDKKSRALAWIDAAEAGKLFLLRSGWNDAFIQECLDFPVGKHDDQVDAVSGAVALLSKSGASRAIHGLELPL
jgi:predicted phage terminase large subunit-like protein